MCIGVFYHSSSTYLLLAYRNRIIFVCVYSLYILKPYYNHLLVLYILMVQILFRDNHVICEESLISSICIHFVSFLVFCYISEKIY